MGIKTNDWVILAIIAVVFIKFSGLFTSVADLCIQKVATASQNVDFRYSSLPNAELSQLNRQNIASYLGVGGSLLVKTNQPSYAIWQKNTNSCSLCGVDTSSPQGYGINANMATTCPGDYCVSNYEPPITVNKGELVCLQSKGFCPPRGVMAFTYPCKACEASDTITVDTLYQRLGESVGSSASTQLIDDTLFVGKEIPGEPDVGQTWLCSKFYITPATTTTIQPPTTTTLPSIIPPSLNFIDRLFADLFSFFKRLFNL